MNSFEARKFVVLSIFMVIGLVFLFRLFYIQVIDDTYKSSAENQALRHVTIYPERGTIYDRNFELLAYDEVAYDLMVIPKQVKDLDTIAFCKLLSISKETFIERYNKARRYNKHKASTFIRQITQKEYVAIGEMLFQYPGFFGQKRSLRTYPHSVASHALGFVGEVNQKILDQDKYYKSGDYIGIQGLEKQYEEVLRGKKGVSVLMVDVHNAVKGSYKDGDNDVAAMAGENLISTIDVKLQAYGEQLMRNKKGSVVAIEPSTGEVLSLISAPTYDPNILVGRNRGNNYAELLSNDSLNPLFNRALMAPYPPGSIYKMVQALIGMEIGVLTPETGFPCNKSLVGCHNHPTASNITRAIQYSCNPYFYLAFKRMINRGEYSNTFKDSEVGLGKWRDHITSFGLGSRLEIDFPSVKGGNIPGPEFYDKLYGHNRWAFSTIYSISIGQGEIEVVPLQMANLAAIIANRGHYFTPHLIKAIGEKGSKDAKYLMKHKTTVDNKHYELVANAMQNVVDAPGGTARRARIEGMEVCGKTGTAENPHGEDHSVFIAFAPKQNPKIAIAVYVENAGFGGTWAAPIASLMIEQYLNDSIANPLKEQRILEANLLDVEVK